MNNEWKNYIFLQLKKGVCKNELERILIMENYSQTLIKNLLYNNKITKCYNRYFLEKIINLKLNDTEKLLYRFLKNQNINNKLKNRIEKEKIVVIDNWLEETICDYINLLFDSAYYKITKTSSENKLNFKFKSAIFNQQIKRFLFIFNALFNEDYLFNGCIGMSKYEKGSFIETHNDNSGYLYQDEKYYRSISCVIYFTKEWKEIYGGNFVDLENNKRIIPKYNRAIFFKVPFKHKVEEIIVDKERHAIFMFFCKNERRYNLSDNKFKKTDSII